MKLTRAIFLYLYGLPSSHNGCFAFTLMIDMCNPPHLVTAKWLAEIFRSTRSKLWPCCLSATFQFVDSVRVVSYKWEKMSSLNVTSLFTRLPVVQTINFFCDQIKQSRRKFML
ncbi:uncharacterized protein DEA37_0004815 [Paragonimus westermani]|uniref:Uncharacterized protein n=1 Tax=Paragonimus westermani TaxID=34504 RepID=A0A5J4NRV9_9TREM|nr:uncharacterized protein DEA37_0004815 [Paragonimus westermani]